MQKIYDLFDHKHFGWIAAALAFCLYLNTANNDYTLDDFAIIKNHSHVQSGTKAIGTLWTTNYLHGLGGFNDGLYRPLSPTTFAIENELHGNDPAYAHILNALLYALAIALLFLWLNQMFGEKQRWMVAIAVLLYAVHPIHTEAVANVKGRDEILAFIGLAGAMYYLFKYLANPTAKQLGLGVLLYLVGLFSKESAVTFIVLFPLGVYFFANDNFKKAAKPLGAYAISVAFFLGVRAWVFGNLGPVDEGTTSLLQNSLAGATNLVDRTGMAAFLQLKYWMQLFAPIRLSHDYSFSAIPVFGLTDIKAIGGLIFSGALLWGLFKGLTSRSSWGFGIAFYLITIAAVANLFLLIGATYAERFVFTPSLGWSIAVAAFLAFSIQRKGKLKTTITTLALVYCGILAAQTINRNLDWKDNYTLYSTDVEKVPNSARANYNIGSEITTQVQEGKLPQTELNKSIFHLQQAVKIYPEYLDAHNNLGNAFKEAGDPQNAIAAYQGAIQQDPNYSKAYFNQAITYYKIPDYAKAAERMVQFVNMRPNNADAWFYLGSAYGYVNQFQQAENALMRCVQINPNRADGWNMLGMAQGFQNKEVAAESSFKKALQLNPNMEQAHTNLGIFYLQRGRKAEAKIAFQNGLQVNPNSQQLQGLLAQANG